ncbi:hypothetical protein [Tardiphaga sp. P9-11]|uniref:hypothetical protein n=1 Tax=Tardiphaga sp. P9-11 TaxID=2024614 RepID=UPI0011F3E52B|nr:hypothetical protein [Tardiphaga sp. P9-11]KAA0069977.1 hypothetical protein CIW50_27805 [Tardiphaga sp. P9-11]
MRFTKAKGLTASEQMLADLCEQSFLSLWSYPNLYKKAGKELTDLLVVFGDDVILFSDKSCAFPASGDATVDWKRWFRKSLGKSAHQICLAEDWIRRVPKEVYLDARATTVLPLPLPPPDRMRIYRVCIALNAAERCEAATGYPTLELSPDTLDDGKPFAVGRISTARGWVHVFDEATLPVVLRELSTVADFLDYLRKKEALYDGGRYKRSFSELDLMAYFLWHDRSFPDHDGDFGTDPGLWQIVEADAQFLAGREQNRISAFWDRLIEYLTGLYMEEELETGNEHEVTDHERMVRLMAGETRFTRRLLSKWILDRADRARDGYVGSMFPSPRADVVYVLFIGPGDGGGDHALYRDRRKKELVARCLAAKAACPDRNLVLGLALDARGVRGSSEDFILMDTADWTEEQMQQGREIREMGQFFQAATTRVDEQEYPAAGAEGMG